MQAEPVERQKEYIVGNVQNCADNGKILLKACTDTMSLKKSEMSEVSYRDSGFLDDRSIYSNSTITSGFKQLKLQQQDNNIAVRHLITSTEHFKLNGPFKKHSQRYDDSGIDKESSSSDIDEIARFNQMELRRQALKSRRKNSNAGKSSLVINTIPKPKVKLSHSNSDRQPLDARNLIYTDGSSSRFEEAESTNVKTSPILNSCGLIMCSTLPTPAFIPQALAIIPSSTPLYIQPVTNGIMENIEDQVNETTSIIKKTKTVTFADSSNDESNETKLKSVKKSLTFQDRTRHQLEEAAFAWQKRQAVKNECLINESEPPIEQSCNSQDNSDNNFVGQDDLNTDEFQFFMNAIEKLKAANLFHEDDLKKMTDEQIYEALIEHARIQKKVNYPVITDNACQSIDREEEDLPIIMRNLHSVKSLKHYFEIKSKSSSSEQTAHSPLLKNVPKSQQDTSSESKNSSGSISPVSIKEDEQQQQQQNEYYNTESASVTREVSVQTEIETNTQEPPAPPPLPAYLFRTLTSEMLQESKKSLLKHSVSYKKRKGPIDIQQSCCSPTPFNEHRDLHEKLIKEIHNKSMERSKKETNICLDERGNLIHKPVGRVYTSVKNHKLYRIKDNATISSVEIKEFPRFDHLKYNMNSKSLDGIMRPELMYSLPISQIVEDLKENCNSPEPTKIDVVAESKTSFACIDIKSIATNELVRSMVSGTNMSEQSETNDPTDITESFITQNSCSDIVSMKLVDSSPLKDKNFATSYKTNFYGQKKKEDKSEDDENDQLSELISISQVPSVFPTIDRKDTIYKSSSFRASSFESSNLESVQEIRRAVSFKSDISADTVSLKSTRSMLSEAKAKLEILSSKLGSKNIDNIVAVDKPIVRNNIRNKSFKKLNDNSNSKSCVDDMIEFEQITKF
jgi:hypothetical protein